MLASLFHSGNRALKITLIYFSVAAVWIYGSDYMLELLIPDLTMLSTAQTYKGLFFVSITSLMLYVLIQAATGRLEERNRRIDLLLKREKDKSFKTEETMQQMQQMLLKAPSPICFLEGPDHVYSFANEAYQKMIGKENLEGKALLEAVPGIKSQGYLEILNHVYQTGEIYIGSEIPMKIEKDGKETVIYRDFIYMPLRDEDEKIYGIFVQANDITRLIRSRERLEDLVEEKEILLQEVHHRVKNNLAIIIGLIELQADHLRESEVIEYLLHTQTRIHTIADIHELLYTQGDLKAIPLQELVHILSESIFRIINSNNQPHCELKIDPHSLDINQAIPLGMIFNELFTFLAGKMNNKNRTVNVYYENTAIPDVVIRIIISDVDPSWIESHLLENGTFEGTLMNIFLEQLKGTATLKPESSGTEIMISFQSAERRGSAGNLKL